MLKNKNQQNKLTKTANMSSKNENETSSKKVYPKIALLMVVYLILYCYEC